MWLGQRLSSNCLPNKYKQPSRWRTRPATQAVDFSGLSKLVVALSNAIEQRSYFNCDEIESGATAMVDQ